jgi:uncharacterized repeat protein (TIGR04138 family)
MSREPKKPIEEVIAELGRYPAEAFVFVQECIGVAADKVHSPMSPDEVHVVQWLAREDIVPDELAARYEQQDLPPDIREALDRIGGPSMMNRHVSGQQLCWAIRDAALERWGLMARSVLTRWNIRSTEDIGEIVFALVDNDWLQKQPHDSIEDFHNVYHFEEAFDRTYELET